MSYQKGEIMKEKKNTPKNGCDDILSYSMKLALINELLRLKKITEQEHSMIKAKIKIEHKIA